MSLDGIGGGSPDRPGAERQQWSDTDDLDRVFGPDTASVTTRTPRQRARRGALVGVFVVAVVGVLAVLLTTIVGSVQNGVGGVFPQPQAALDRFTAQASDIDGVQDVRGDDPRKTSFASYDVVAVVTADPRLTDEQRTAVVDGLRAAADDASGNGVRVFAVADLGAQQVGVSADSRVTGRRLELARRVDAIGGVQSVRCAWGDAPSDEAGDQRVVLRSTGRGGALRAVLVRADQAAQDVFPGSAVRAEPPAD